MLAKLKNKTCRLIQVIQWNFVKSSTLKILWEPEEFVAISFQNSRDKIKFARFKRRLNVKCGSFTIIRSHTKIPNSWSDSLGKLIKFYIATNKSSGWYTFVSKSLWAKKFLNRLWWNWIKPNHTDSHPLFCGKFVWSNLREKNTHEFSSHSLCGVFVYRFIVNETIITFSLNAHVEIEWEREEDIKEGISS